MTERIKGRWYWVRAVDGPWWPALWADEYGVGWSNQDCWEDWNNEVVEWRLIPLPEELPQ